MAVTTMFQNHRGDSVIISGKITDRETDSTFISEHGSNYDVSEPQRRLSSLLVVK
jgi:hypothetical protein